MLDNVGSLHRAAAGEAEQGPVGDSPHDRDRIGGVITTNDVLLLAHMLAFITYGASPSILTLNPKSTYGGSLERIFFRDS